jgi:hypothetical protein
MWKPSSCALPPSPSSSDSLYLILSVLCMIRAMLTCACMLSVYTPSLPTPSAAQPSRPAHPQQLSGPPAAAGTAALSSSNRTTPTSQACAAGRLGEGEGERGRGRGGGGSSPLWTHLHSWPTSFCIHQLTAIPCSGVDLWVIASCLCGVAGSCGWLWWDAAAVVVRGWGGGKISGSSQQASTAWCVARLHMHALVSHAMAWPRFPSWDGFMRVPTSATVVPAKSAALARHTIATEVCL